jgi:ubiquinone/menaquinone biosynthesis C-methylase UbiE
MADENDHSKAIIRQFTLQAIPFTQVAGHSRQEALQLYREMSRISDDDIVLDVACGPGLVACEFATIARQVTGIDITPAMIDQARKLQAEMGLANVTWQLGEAAPLPFRDASFSLVFTRFSFHHFVNPLVVLREMLRVCAPGGRVAVVDVALPPDKVDAYNRMEKLRDPSHTRALTVGEFGAMLLEVGLQEVRTAYHTVEVELESQIKASFPNPGDDEKIRRIFLEDLGKDALGVGAHWRGKEIWFAYPILVLVGKK